MDRLSASDKILTLCILFGAKNVNYKVFKNFEIAKDCKMHKLIINHTQPLLPLFYLTYLIIFYYISFYLP